MTSRPLSLRRSAFQSTMVGLNVDGFAEDRVDIFSKACLAEFESAESHHHRHKLSQVFEPEVLQEAAFLEGVPYALVASMAHRPSPALQSLARILDCRDTLSMDELCNLSSALISISRYQAAAQVLSTARKRSGTAREMFEMAMLEFIICNRAHDGVGSDQAFRMMRACIEASNLSAERVLDACAQAVVWYLKRRELAEVDYRWFLAKGRQTAEHAASTDPGAVSSWYRALAMVPAENGDSVSTRADMERAYAAANATYKIRPNPYELHFVKTYYESTLKEHMYITRDFSEAEAAGLALIAVDPAWAPSYGETAEMYAKFKQYDAAVEYYERAVSMGAPYVLHHLQKAEQLNLLAGHVDRATECKEFFNQLTTNQGRGMVVNG